jgi:hypothetical protein
LKIRGIGVKYAGLIGAWQARVQFAPEVAYVGPMIVADARRILELIEQIDALEAACARIVEGSELAGRIDSIPGFGPITNPHFSPRISCARATALPAGRPHLLAGSSSAVGAESLRRPVPMGSPIESAPTAGRPGSTRVGTVSPRSLVRNAG